jgi:hypothetical protein
MVITTRLYGGLGNQMFQYAIARAYQLRTGIPFVVDTAYLKRAPVPRQYELNHFACNPQMRNHWQRIHKTDKVDERFTTPDKFNTLALDNLELVGYWQNEKYFANESKTIRKDFSLKEKPGLYNQRMLDEITDCNDSVSIHVRMGDYIGNPVHPIIQKEYYTAAMDVIESKVNRPHYFLFSDDPIATFTIPESDFVTPVNLNDVSHGYLDLELMKHCQHHIIANSSFSWWGAWLGENPDKIVVAPKHWFNGQEFDGILGGWVRV